jgi:hypothetical protein
MASDLRFCFHRVSSRDIVFRAVSGQRVVKIAEVKGVASLRYRSGGWDLRYRERSGKERTERFQGGTPKRPPAAALDRKGAVEYQLVRGTFVSPDLRERPFRAYYERWAETRQISARTSLHQRQPCR